MRPGEMLGGMDKGWRRGSMIGCTMKSVTKEMQSWWLIESGEYFPGNFQIYSLWGLEIDFRTEKTWRISDDTLTTTGAFTNKGKEVSYYSLQVVTQN